MYSHTTHDITVTVRPFFLEEQSAPEENRYVWAYRIRIENFSPRTVQLLNRHWIITDATGCSQDVRGSGVVGAQPVLHPGESFEYTSGAPLATPSGMMHGSYEMEGEGGERFEIVIPAFSLDSPHDRPSLN